MRPARPAAMREATASSEACFFASRSRLSSLRPARPRLVAPAAGAASLRKIEEPGCLKPLPHAALAAVEPGASGDAGAREEPSSQLRGSCHGPTMAIDKESKAPKSTCGC